MVTVIDADNQSPLEANVKLTATRDNTVVGVEHKGGEGDHKAPVAGLEDDGDHGIGVASDDGVDGDVVQCAEPVDHLHHAEARAHGAAARVYVDGDRRVGPALALDGHHGEGLAHLRGGAVVYLPEEVDAVGLQVSLALQVGLYQLVQVYHRFAPVLSAEC